MTTKRLSSQWYLSSWISEHRPIESPPCWNIWKLSLDYRTKEVLPEMIVWERILIKGNVVEGTLLTVLKKGLRWTGCADCHKTLSCSGYRVARFSKNRGYQIEFEHQINKYFLWIYTMQYLGHTEKICHLSETQI